MGWPYAFLSLTPEEVAARRLLLNAAGLLGLELSLAPLVGTAVFRAGRWAVAQARERFRRGGGAYEALSDRPASAATATPASVPDSPLLKSQRLTVMGAWAVELRRAQWWLADDVVVWKGGASWGQRDQWLFGGLYMAALLVLCTVGTGRDYMHLTKRFGIVAVSQMPLHYLLALKLANPCGRLLGASHEQLNRWHRVLGVLLYALLTLHTVFYLNFFAHMGNVLHRLARPIVLAGLVAFACLSLLSATSLAAVRRFSYRVFFFTHVAVAMAMPALVFYHARPARGYMAGALLLLLVDIALRRLAGTTTVVARLEAIPGTDLLQLSAPVPAARLGRFLAQPAAHVYVSLPRAARPSSSSFAPASLLFEGLFNPFTVVSVDKDTRVLTLVIRRQKGPMTAALARHCPAVHAGPTTARPLTSDEEDDADDAGQTDGLITAAARAHRDDEERSGAHQRTAAATLPVNVDGPYGCSAYFPELSTRHFDRVLLVAGGVGATFTLPIYHALLRSSHRPGLPVDFVWAVRHAAEAAWAVMLGEGGRSLLDDRNVHIFVTGGDPTGTASSAGTTALAADGIELANTARDGPGRQRPDLVRIVDNVFRHGSEERVAVLVCGPESMARDLRTGVGRWVRKGRTVWWHQETFGL